MREREVTRTIINNEIICNVYNKETKKTDTTVVSVTGPIKDGEQAEKIARTRLKRVGILLLDVVEFVSRETLYRMSEDEFIKLAHKDEKGR